MMLNSPHTHESAELANQNVIGGYIWRGKFCFCNFFFLMAFYVFQFFYSKHERTGIENFKAGVFQEKACAHRRPGRRGCPAPPGGRGSAQPARPLSLLPCPPSRRPAFPPPPAWPRGPRALCPALVTRQWGGQGAYLRMCATSWVVRGLSSTLLEPVGQKPQPPRRGVPPPGEARLPASPPRA